MRGAALITRPEPAASALRTALALRGIASVLAPVLVLQARVTSLPDCAAVGGVIFTSANAVRHLPYPQLPQGWAAWPCYCVGAATAAAATRAGWQKPISADGDGAALAALMLAQPTRQVWLHPCGVERRDEPATTLRAQGHRVIDWEVYDAVAATAMPQQALAALQAQGCAAALFYSPRSAQCFADLMLRAGLEHCAAGLTAWCLSAPIGQAAAALPWRAICVAATPDETTLLTSLQNWFRQEKMPPFA